MAETINLADYEIVPGTGGEMRLKPSAMEYLGQQALQGATSPLGGATGTGAGMGMAQGATGFAPLLQYLTGDKSFQQPEVTPQATQEASTKVREALGIKTDMQAPGYLSGTIGGGVRAAADPYSYLIPNAGPLKSLITNFLYGAYAEEGAKVGENIGGQTGRAVGALGATVFNPSVALEATLNNMKGSKFISPEKMNELASQFGSQKAAAMVAAAYSADPALKAKLLRAADLSSATGVNIPLLSAADNTVLTATGKNLAARDLSFKAAYAQLEQDAAAQVMKRQGGLFGSPSEAKMFDSLGAPTKVVPKIESRMQSVDSQLAQVAQDFERSNYQEIGEKLRNLTNAKYTQVSQEVGKKYDNVIALAEKEGYKVSSQETGQLFDFVNNAEQADIFKQFPSLNGLIKKNFQPKEVPPSMMVNPDTGQPLIAASKEFPTASMKDLDSLKREVNKTIRNLPDAKSDLLPYLQDLKKQVSNVVSNMPGELGSTYKAVDSEFAARVGIPYGAKTVEDIRYKDFVESSIPALTKNKTALGDYLASVDRADASNVVKDAFFADATRYGVIKDGVFDPKRLGRYIDAHKDTLSLVPEVRDALRKTSVDGLELQATLGKLDKLKAVQDTQASAQIFNKLNSNGLEGVASTFLSSPEFRSKFMSAGGAGRNDAAIKTLRAKLTENAMNSADPMAYMDANKEAFSSAFGKTYLKEVQNLGEVGSILQNKLVGTTPITTVQRTGLEELTGTSPATALSIARERISSVVHKTAVLLSRFYVNQADKSTRSGLSNLLADPQAVSKINTALTRLDALNTKGISEGATKLANDIASSAATIMVRRGVVAAEIGSRPVQEVSPKQETVDLNQYEVVQ